MNSPSEIRIELEAEHKQGEEVRLQAKNQYRDLFEETPIMYAITRNDGGTPIISDCNRSFLQTVGYIRENILGRPLSELYTPESHVKSMEGSYQRTLEGNSLLEDRQLIAKGQIKGVREIFHRAHLAPDPEWLDFL